MNKPAANASFEKVVVPASEAKGSAGAPLTITWRTLRSLGDEIDAWRDLAGQALEPNVFLEPAFACAAASHLPNEQVSALVVHEANRLVGLLPGRVEGLARGRPVATFVAWTHSFAPLSTPLVDRDLAPDVVAALLECLAGNSRRAEGCAVSTTPGRRTGRGPYRGTPEAGQPHALATRSACARRLDA